jgi:trigger factor
MQVTVEDISSVKKTLRIEIPREEVAREIENAYDQLRKTAKIKGFRPGKTPRSVLERMFKKDVLADVSSRLIQTSFIDAIKQKELRVVGQPKLDPPVLSGPGAYAYAATVEVSPHIADIDFKGLSLKRSRYQVSEEEVDAQLRQLQKNMGTLRPIAEVRAVRDGDHVLIDFEGFKGGKAYAETPKTENFTLQVGAGAVLPEFGRQCVGMSAGETKQFPLTFPEDYANKSLAGQTVEFLVALKEIREEILPEIDDALAKRSGRYETLEELKREIRANLTQGYEKRAEQELNEQVFKALLERSQFEVPETLVEMELDGIVEEAERSFSYRNTTLADAGLSREIIAQKYRETAVNQVRRHLILGHLIVQEKLAISDAELEEAIQAMAANFKQPVEEIRRYYRENDEKLDYYKHALLEKKALKLVLESSTIEEVEPAAA